MIDDSLPGDLGSDLVILQTRLSILMNATIKFGEEKARTKMMLIIRDLMQEKDMAGDDVAVQVLNWLWLSLADKYQVEIPD